MATSRSRKYLSWGIARYAAHDTATAGRGANAPVLTMAPTHTLDLKLGSPIDNGATKITPLPPRKLFPSFSGGTREPKKRETRGKGAHRPMRVKQGGLCRSRWCFLWLPHLWSVFVPFWTSNEKVYLFPGIAEFCRRKKAGEVGVSELRSCSSRWIHANSQAFDQKAGATTVNQYSLGSLVPC